MEVRSPYLEELLSLLMTVGTQNGTAGPVAMVISLLLQESEERAVQKEVDSNKWGPQFYFPLMSCKKHRYLTGLNDKHDSLWQELLSVALYSETAIGFGSERFNWFCSSVLALQIHLLWKSQNTLKNIFHVRFKPVSRARLCWKFAL